MVDKIANDTKIYTDVQGLENLRYEAVKNNPAAKKEVAKQFESMLLQMLLHSMRDANKAIASDMFGSDQMDLYQDLFDKQLSLVLAEKGGIGFAKTVEQNIDRMQGVRTTDSTPKAKTLSIEDEIKQRRSYTSNQAFSVQKHTTEPAQTPSAPSATPEVAKLENVQKEKSSFETPEEFVKYLWPAAKAAASMLGTNPQVLLAQAALETNWGKKVMPHDKETSSYNLFNIKTGSNWDKKSTEMATLEQKNGLLVKEKSAFRSYDSFKESFMDYVNLLKQNDRYKNAVDKAANPHEFVHALQHSGYATDQNYADKIMNIFSSRSFKELMAKVE